MTEPSSDKLLRLRCLIGDEGVTRLQQSFVCIVGLGAVGSYATEALARSGVGRLRIVDFDDIRPSNFNRQLYALNSTLGQAKTTVACQRILDIQENCRVEPLHVFAHEDSMDQILHDSPHLVIDAIDSLTPKVALLAACQDRSLPVISSMGAALRRDPSQIRTGPLSKTQGCTLARQVRKRLRRRQADMNIPCVYSTESTRDLPALVIGQEADNEDSLHRGRIRRPLGSLPTLTGIFGLTLANLAIEMLLE